VEYTAFVVLLEVLKCYLGEHLVLVPLHSMSACVLSLICRICEGLEWGDFQKQITNQGGKGRRWEKEMMGDVGEGVVRSMEGREGVGEASSEGVGMFGNHMY